MDTPRTKPQAVHNGRMLDGNYSRHLQTGRQSDCWTYDSNKSSTYRYIRVPTAQYNLDAIALHALIYAAGPSTRLHLPNLQICWWGKLSKQLFFLLIIRRGFNLNLSVLLPFPEYYLTKNIPALWKPYETTKYLNSITSALVQSDLHATAL